MKMISALKGTNLYIENDWTKEERKIEAELRKIAEVERERELQVKIGYKKIIIEDECYLWSSKEGGGGER